MGTSKSDRFLRNQRPFCGRGFFLCKGYFKIQNMDFAASDHEVWRLDGCLSLKAHRKRPLAAIFPASYTLHTPVAVDIEDQKCKLEFFFSFRKFFKKVEKKCENYGPVFFTEGFGCGESRNTISTPVVCLLNFWR